MSMTQDIGPGDPERCAVCGCEVMPNDFYDDICDDCAKEDGMDGPWDDK